MRVCCPVDFSTALPCRYGYSSIWEMQEVVDNYTKANIPLDVMWGDIDYMERWRDFTFDPVNFPLPALQVSAFAKSIVLQTCSDPQPVVQCCCFPRILSRAHMTLDKALHF